MSIKLIELASYTTPAVVEHKNKEWVEYGEDNNYYGYLIDLYYGSPTNNAAIKAISDMIYGDGLEVVQADRHLSGYLDLKKIFHADCLRNAAMDLKMLGQCAIHLVKSKDKKKYVAAYHWPVQTLRPERCNDDGEIEGYYFAADWSKLKRGQKPKRFAAFGYDNNDSECIMLIKPYSTGNYYFAPVDYQGGTQYANLEIEIANYHINNIMNGLAPSMLINFNNGQPPAEVKDMIEAQIQTKFSGSSNAGKFILSFNDNSDSKADITPVQLSDAHNQYQFLSGEASSKILISHRVTSPMLLGIKDNTGLGNNADELKTASTLFDNTVIRPFQRLLLDGIKQIMNANGYNLDVYFKTLQPLEFTDLSGKAVDAETKEKEYGFSLDMENPCQAGYEAYGMKPKNGRMVPNCIPIDATDITQNGKPLFRTIEEAEAAARKIGCKGSHPHEMYGKTYYMPCEKHSDLTDDLLEEYQFASYTDYPESASNNAKRALKWVEKHGWGDCGEATGKRRANQLANKEPISRDTIARMASFRRHQQHKDVPYSEGCGGLMWDCWGGESGIAWAERKLKEIDAKLSQHFEGTEMTHEDEHEWLDYLAEKGEVIGDEYELVLEEEVTDTEAEGKEYKFFKRFADPEKKSNDDKGVFLIRYRYAPMRTSNNSRTFCKDMVANAKMGVVYRREDITQMGEQGINGQFAPKGKTNYSIWKFKGGVNCHHNWYRLTYVRKRTKGGNYIPLTPEEKSARIREIEENYKRVSNQSADREGVPFSPPGWSEASTKPINMPNQGRLN